MVETPFWGKHAQEMLRETTKDLPRVHFLVDTSDRFSSYFYRQELVKISGRFLFHRFLILHERRTVRLLTFRLLVSNKFALFETKQLYYADFEMWSPGALSETKKKFAQLQENVTFWYGMLD